MYPRLILPAGLAEVIEDFGLVSYTPLAIEDKESVQRLVSLIDKATGYVFAGLAGHSPYPPEFVYGAGATEDSATADMWDRYQAGQPPQGEMYIQEHADEH